MSVAKPDLVLFSNQFPNGEAVLWGELKVLANRFERVFIVPSVFDSNVVDVVDSDVNCLPGNAVVVNLGWGRKSPRPARPRVLASRIAMRVVWRTLRNPSNRWPYLRHARAYAEILAEQLLRAHCLAEWIEENGLRDAVFYDFWFENTTLALALLRRRGAIRCAVSRAHGFDVFDSRWGAKGRVPFREFKAESLDAVFAVSEDGARYLRGKFGAEARKVHLARLGIPASTAFPEAVAEPPLVVSCSWLRPDKRVHAIPDVLRAFDRPLRWVHFGDGPERPRVEEAAARLPATVSWELRGPVENAAVREFYATEPVSAFLSLSGAEGVPISMMEAQSAGIPIVALSVGGVPEIVTPETGVLLPPGAGAPRVAEALQRAIEPASFDRAEIRAAFAGRYEASANYGAFADDLLEIWSENVVGG